MHPGQPQYTAIKWGETSRSFSRNQFYLRLAGFILLEGGFLGLARLGLEQPLPIQSTLSLTNGKALFTVLSILWHFLATLLLEPIIQHVFASEWQYITRRTGYLFPGADRVSTHVSGFLDYIPHFLAGNCSWGFRFSLAARVICLAIKGLLPGTIAFDSVLLSTPIPINVANLTTGLNISSVDVEFGQRRAAMIVRIETREQSTFAFNTEEHWIVGWPHVPTGNAPDYRVIYPSDVIHYDFKCHWEAPNFTSFATMSNGGVKWKFLDDPASWFENVNPDKPFLGVVIPVFTDMQDQVSRDSELSAFFFLGGNDTLRGGGPPDPKTDTYLQLNNVPTMYNASGFYLPPSYGNFSDPVHTVAPLATLLVCDPQRQLSSGEAIFWPNGSIEVIESSLNMSGRLGNFLDENIRDMFVFGSREVFLDYSGPENRITFNNTMLTFNSAVTFLNDSAFAARPYNEINQTGFSVLPLEQIEANMTKVFSYVAKAFTNGLRLESHGGAYMFNTMPVDATTQKPAEAFVTNFHLFWVAVVLVIAEIFSMIVLGIQRDWRNREPLGLECILLEVDKGGYIQWNAGGIELHAKG
ncbi:hypothetical protein D9756_002997 [Leucocoprinus leucothites]|uniref:Uncharacterized protein n=1 Tax=Leucocoprinus leucothites TaxID=201217 RepID=A0A8H5G733_9AGAR|nr:hypothetical protein D9756_002997 [Leucoagaricus leucothites]